MIVISRKYYGVISILCLLILLQSLSVVSMAQSVGNTSILQVAGSQNVGQRNGSQFITGQCFFNDDCASGCCALSINQENRGFCSAVPAQFDRGKQGCGSFEVSLTEAGNINGDRGGIEGSVTNGNVIDDNDDENSAGQFSPNITILREAGFQNVGQRDGSQFITGQCFFNDDCASGCCALSINQENRGFCSAVPAQFDRGKQGCGSFEANLSDVDERNIGEGVNEATGGQFVANTDILDVAGSQSVGRRNGDQFITGQCFSDEDCATGCCALNVNEGNRGFCSAVLAQFERGKQGCGSFETNL